MSSEWTEVRLKDITSILGDGLHGTPDYDDNGDYYFINGNNLIEGKIVVNDKTKRVSISEYQKHKKPLGDRTILVSINGTLGNVALYENEKVILGKSACYFNLLEDVDKQFVKYVITSECFQSYIDNLATGSTIKNVSLKLMRDFAFRLPPLAIQQKISSVLKALDDRIALLRETNATLEAISQALFKSWFIDFDAIHAKQQGIAPEGLDEATAALFPDGFEESKLGLIPRGWKVGTLENWLTVLETGRRPKGGVSGIDNGVPSIGAESITRIGQFDYSKTKYVSHDFFSKMKSGKLVSRDVLLYKDGGKPGVFLPRVSMFGDEFPFAVCGINEHVFRMRLREPFNQTFLYFWLWSDAVMHEIKHRGGKAAIPGINQTDVKEQRLLIPTEAILFKYDDLTSPLMARILSNSTKIQTLSILRDTLLPRLISGQLRLPEADIAHDRVAAELGVPA